ncbi:hypothetical protein REPUB_Repub12eG0042800 [Reevesia pubescens]
MVITIAVFSGAFALSRIIYFYIFKHKMKVKDLAVSVPKSSWGQIPCPSNSTCATSVSLLPSDLCRRFSIIEIKEATFNFDEQFIIGSKGFGHIYQGCIDGGSTTAAIKRLDSSSRQGTREFQIELEILSKLCHVNLVSLIGFCDDNDEMILIYEYMPRGTLRNNLYKTKKPTFTMKKEAGNLYWSRPWIALPPCRGSLEQIVDPNLVGDISPLCLKKFSELAERCIRDEKIDRPMMNDVVWGSEFAQQIQEATERNMNRGNDYVITNSSQTSPLNSHGEVSIVDDDDDDLFSASGAHVSDSKSTISNGGKSVIQSDINRIKSESVFSKIRNANGR